MLTFSIASLPLSGSHLTASSDAALTHASFTKCQRILRPAGTFGRSSHHLALPRRPATCAAAPGDALGGNAAVLKTAYTVYNWNFRSFCTQYAVSGLDDVEASSRPAVVLIHGFGGNCQHWRRNLHQLALAGYRVFAMDLLGFGMGDKPPPASRDADGIPVMYTFDLWTEQLRAFIDEVVEPNSDRPVFLVANSIGAMIVLQYAVQLPERCAALIAISPSLRQLNVRKRSWLQNITAPLLMRALMYHPIGSFFFDSLVQPKLLRTVLQKAYTVHAAIDDELVTIISGPARTEGALDVFLSFISYDYGPIPEDWLPDVSQPTMIIWGEEDQFEPFELGQALSHYSAVESFVPLPDTGHCAHDERPDECNRLITDFIGKHRLRAEPLVM